MSDELRLPDELAAIEARLAAHPLPPSALNRDELLYQAGWAACEARYSPLSKGAARGGIPDDCVTPTKSMVAAVELESPSPVPSLRGRGTIAAWSLASAALAASLAVAATLALSPRRGPAIADEAAADSRPSLAAIADAKSEDAPTPRADEVDRVLANLDAMLRTGRSTPSASLWASLGGPRRQRWDQPIVVPVVASATSATPTATARGLLEELLPSPRVEAAPAAMPWLRRFAIPREEPI